jgi:hypothetical protein
MKIKNKLIGFALCSLACFAPALSVGNASADAYFERHPIYQLYFLRHTLENEKHAERAIKLERDIARIVAQTSAKTDETQQSHFIER